MFIDTAEEAVVGTFRTDGYNKLSLILCTAGILVVGILSGIYEYIGGISFGM